MSHSASAHHVSHSVCIARAPACSRSLHREPTLHTTKGARRLAQPSSLCGPTRRGGPPPFPPSRTPRAKAQAQARQNPTNTSARALPRCSPTSASRRQSQRAGQPSVSAHLPAQQQQQHRRSPSCGACLRPSSVSLACAQCSLQVARAAHALLDDVVLHQQPLGVQTSIDIAGTQRRLQGQESCGIYRSNQLHGICNFSDSVLTI